MTDPTTPPAAAPLQFETAELPDAPATRACGVCKQPLQHSYFDVNGTVACPGCKDTLLASLRGGSGFVRWLKASALGTVAAALGAAGYSAFIMLTDSNFGLIAIAVGWAVGTAVSMGSERRGGVFYQLMALSLTYLSIGASLVPLFLREVAADTGTGERIIMGFFMLFAGPVLVSIEAPISGLIYGFGLWEAWRRNKKPVVSVNGPFEVASAEPEPVAVPQAHAAGT